MPLPCTPPRRSTAHMAPWAVWMGRCNQSGRTRAQEVSHLSWCPLPLKWINNGREENSEQNKSIIIICYRMREFTGCRTVLDIHFWFSKNLFLVLRLGCWALTFLNTQPCISHPALLTLDNTEELTGHSGKLLWNAHIPSKYFCVVYSFTILPRALVMHT